MTQAPQEVHSLANAVNHLLTTLRRSLGQEKRFLNDAAHQLRTPLAGLISQTELALQETDPQALHQRLTKVHTGAVRSAHLVQQLLSLARTKAEVALQPVDVAALARAVAREWTPRALAAGVDLGYEGDDALMVPADKLLLREALSNLLEQRPALRRKGHNRDPARPCKTATACWKSKTTARVWMMPSCPTCSSASGAPASCPAAADWGLPSWQR